ncbi:MAG: bifunctional folylpolyglutamate synthase/dihydrofolate synthase [Gemmatimonadaceae bacterium]
MDDFLTTYGEAIKDLFARTTGGIKPGLERTEALLLKMGSPQRKIAAIHVAGTNGKGSVVATCEALLRARNLRVGRYTSPHLIDFRERITVNGESISEREVLDWLREWIPLAEELGASFFEVTTALAFDWLAQKQVDFCVIETGLGGRLDSTNVLMPRVATVTSIGLDHTDLLGDTLEAIAKEKAGIFKPGVPAVIGEPDSGIRELLANCARDAGASDVIMLDERYTVGDAEVSLAGTSFTLTANENRQRVTTPLLGEYQARNTATAMATIEALGKNWLPSSGDLSRALGSVFLPGRFQRVGNIVLDVAHNPAGARTVAKTINDLDLPRPRTALIAVLSDKDWRGIVEELAPAIDQFVFTSAPSAPEERRWNPADAASFAEERGLVADAQPDFVSALSSAQNGIGTVLITGSFHTVGDAMSRLHLSPFAG